ncbi:MAG: hypothetical protein M3Z31_11300 [Pseudomonadota bacterium]|nr:hypothetical protein [Pseudomonadota bacterium]
MDFGYLKGPLPRWTGAVSSLFVGVKLAEEISRDISFRQAALAPDSRMRRFFELQSKQEAMHATVFDVAARLTARRAGCPASLSTALDCFAARLHSDLDAGLLPESVVGLQGVFEALGEVALSAPRGRIAGFAARLVPLRSTFLKQERMHHRYGRRCLQQLVADDRVRERLRASSREYFALGAAVLAASIELFDGFEAEQRRYAEDGDVAICGVETELHCLIAR